MRTKGVNGINQSVNKFIRIMKFIVNLAQFMINKKKKQTEDDLYDIWQFTIGVNLKWYLTIQSIFFAKQLNFFVQSFPVFWHSIRIFFLLPYSISFCQAAQIADFIYASQILIGISVKRLSFNGIIRYLLFIKEESDFITAKS